MQDAYDESARACALVESHLRIAISRMEAA
ncbi:hypothetical protein EDC27_2154 [Desulfosoma caldarium]|uniref:Uncharacterized protein n=1 Tax=Desulfosoma caldarium TaxID=610254 RepID=A0A3N1ULC6_9BACT|nr:hypothetical protein EDC27_2154 [Desulfosoma caldarium]